VSEDSDPEEGEFWIVKIRDELTVARCFSGTEWECIGEGQLRWVNVSPVCRLDLERILDE
jgi:hypothetical protein